MILATNSPVGNLSGFHGTLEQYTPYLIRLLRRRRVAVGRLDEAMAIVRQSLAVLWLEQGRPGSWPMLRRLLDRAVYLATRELGSATLPLKGDEPVPPSRRKPSVSALQCLDALPPGERLLLRLKQAWYYYPQLPDSVHWEWDEAAYLTILHPERSVEAVTTEFLTRLCRKGGPVRRVPAEVIAWLLRRKSANAVDQAYRTLRHSLQTGHFTTACC
jgi:hypothetical protein